MTRDVVGIVEAAYALEPNDSEWLGGVLDRAAPLLDKGLGVIAYGYDASVPGAVLTLHPRCAGIQAGRADQFCRMVQESNAALTPEQTHAAYSEGGPVKTVSAAFDTRPHDIPGIGAHIRPLASDFLVILAQDPSRRGCALAAPLGDVARPSPAERRLWSRVAAHLAAGCRIRRGLSESLETAVLSPGGRVQHAAADARAPNMLAALRDAARRIDRARSKARGDPSEALTLWQGLVAGRWSLVDRFETDGRRYVIARENQPHVGDPRALSLRERQVLAYSLLGHPLKLIAYELGLSVSAVSQERRRALRKLGAKSIAEAARLVGKAPAP